MSSPSSQEARDWLRAQGFALASDSQRPHITSAAEALVAAAYWRKVGASHRAMHIERDAASLRGTDADQLPLFSALDEIEAVDALPFGQWGAR